MAHTKAIGSSKNGRESRSKRLGVKIQDGGMVMIGQIIVRQRGSHYIAGANVNQASDDTLFAAKNGVVNFTIKSKTRFDGKRRSATLVSVK